MFLDKLYRGYPHRIALVTGTNAVEGSVMSEESDRMLTLLLELAAMKDADEQTQLANAKVFGKRRTEIREEMKQLAAQKKEVGS